MAGQTALGTAPAMTADAYTITLVLTAAELADIENSEIVLVTQHTPGKGNFVPEDGTPYSYYS
jgi:hypothetical protein